MPADTLLEDYELEETLAAKWDVSPKTLSRYRCEPNGLPFMKLGGKVYIHVPGAREWIKRRTVRRNPIPGYENR
jgi:hypothetical protein